METARRQIEAKMKANGWDAETLCDKTGVDSRAIRRWLGGSAAIRIRDKMKLLAALKITPGRKGA